MLFFGISLFSSASIDGKTIKHPVQAGESLYTISERYGVSQASIQRINQLQTNQLEAGTTLTIPTASQLPIVNGWRNSFMLKQKENPMKEKSR